MNWDLDLVRMGERLKEKEIRLLRLRRPTAGEQEAKNHNRHWSLIEIYNNLINSEDGGRKWRCTGNV